MSTSQLIFIASLVGAALFFAAGAAWTAMRGRGTALDALASTIPAMPSMPAADPTEVAQLRAALAQANAAQRDLQHAFEDRATHVKRDEHLRVAAQASAELAAMRTRAEKAEASLATQAAELERATKAAQRPAVDLPAKVDATAKRELEQARAEVVASTREAEQLRTRVTELERDLAERVRAARDLSTETEQLRGKVRDAEALRAEYVRLRTSVTDSEYLRSEVARLEGELRAVKVDAINASRPRPARGTDPTLGDATVVTDPRTAGATVVTGARPRRASENTATGARAHGTIGDALTRAIERFADASTRSTALGDVAGFPLASNGSEGVALAAYAAAMLESATRAGQFLPVTAPAAIEIVDDRGTRVTVWTVDVDADRLVLANLAVGPADPQRVQTTLGEVARILAPSQPRG